MVNLYCRCSKYSRVPSGCSLVPDPKDPSCCEVPHCDMIIPSIPPTPGILTPPMPQPGIITGTGKVPNLIGGIFYNHLIYLPLYLNLFSTAMSPYCFFFFFLYSKCFIMPKQMIVYPGKSLEFTYFTKEFILF